jgi:signal transduction histidine kinase/DNA-binding LacI/PurR family transcriptional regulator
MLKIGLFVEQLASQYHQNVWAGVAETAQQRGVHLLTFVTGLLSQPLTPPNTLFEFIWPGVLDGVILLKAGEMEGLAADQRPSWVTHLAHLPVVRIGLPFEIGVSIEVENKISSEQMLEHLIIHHHCQTIAFIAGANEHPDALIREEAYRNSLQRYQLPILPELRVQGKFSRPSGKTAMFQLLDTFSGKLDAVFAANDEMALGAIEALQERGYDVPDDILVVGFDDVQEGQVGSSPLTTVRQPLVEMGQRALEMVLDQVHGRAVEKSVLLPSQFIVRQSCGCLSQSVLKAGLETAVIHNDDLPLPRSIINELVALSLADAQSPVTNKFLPTLTKIMRQEAHTGLPAHKWQNLITVIHQEGLPICQDPETRNRAVHLWRQARVLVADAAYRNQAARGSQLARQTVELSGVIQHINRSFDVKQLQRVLAVFLPRLGIEQCFTAVYDPAPSSPGGSCVLPATARLLPSLTKEGLPVPSPEPVSSRHLVDSFLSASHPERVIVQSLYQNYKQIGLVVFFVPLQMERLYQYELLQSQISSVLSGALLVEQIQEHAADLEHEVARRTENLRQTNLQLKQYAAELERSNRELEAIAYIASHDLQEPLRKIRVFADRLAEYSHDQLDERAQDYLARMQNASSRMQTLIYDLLMFSRATTKPLALQKVDLNGVVRAILEELAPTIQAAQAQVTLADLPTLEADEFQMNLLLQNILRNALKFHQPDQPAIVSVHCEEIQAHPLTYRITIQDNGIGFDEKYHERIFQAFQRLHSRSQYEGSGIGLAICRRIVERHHGHIYAHSSPGQGATFFLELPARYHAR